MLLSPRIATKEGDKHGVFKVATQLSMATDDCRCRNIAGWCRQAVRILASAILLVSAGSFAAAPDPEDGPLEELVVEGDRVKLSTMRADLEHLEDRFYDRYNQLNAKDEFDVHCARETRAGSRLERRYCLAAFERDALAVEGISYHRYLLACCDMSVPKGTPVAPSATQSNPVIVAISARRPAFQKNLAEVTKDHPELLGILEQRGKALKQYDAERRRAFGRISKSEDPGASRAGGITTP
ncbi:MAG: hypothetical protein ABW278_00920 [Steroidobacteraceae bacterium]